MAAQALSSINHLQDEWDFYSMDLADALIAEIEPTKRAHRGYSTELAMKICLVVSQDRRSLNDIVAAYPDFPSAHAINYWRVFYPIFGRNFNVAKKCQAQLLIDEIIQICDDPANCEPNILNWAKLRITTRQFLASKLLPKIYGDLKQPEESVSSADALLKIKELVADFNKVNESDV